MGMLFGGGEFDPNSAEQQKKSPFERAEDERKAAAMGKMGSEEGKNKDTRGPLKRIFDMIGGKTD